MIRRLLQLMALTIMTIVCASNTSPAGISSVSHVIVVAADGARAPAPAHQWCDVVEQDGEEGLLDDNEIDDDDDSSHVAEAIAIRGARFPRKPAGTLRDAPSIDTSRFAMGTGLPRGPPIT